MITKDQKRAVTEPFRAHSQDTGGASVQIAVLTSRINNIASHMTGNKKDYSSRLGLLKMVGQRRRLLNYLGRSNETEYKKVLSELKLRK